jgi:hypothetical protein
MADRWMPGDTGEDELERLFALDRESWRGDLHGDDEPWRVCGDTEAAWRGDEHFAEWPEASAGPEYWMFKRAADRG